MSSILVDAIKHNATEEAEVVSDSENITRYLGEKSDIFNLHLLLNKTNKIWNLFSNDSNLRKDYQLQSLFVEWERELGNRYRDYIFKKLSENGIATNSYYSPPLHLQPVYKKLGLKKGSFPVSEELSNELICLPIYPSLSSQNQEYIINNFNKLIN